MAVDAVAGELVGLIAKVFFFDVSFGYAAGGIPLAVIWLVLGAIFFTFRMGFINVRAFKHALRVTAGKYDRPEDAGEVTHFQALTAALSATVGLGNIAGSRDCDRDRGPWSHILDDHRRLSRNDVEIRRVHARPEIPRSPA